MDIWGSEFSQKSLVNLNSLSLKQRLIIKQLGLQEEEEEKKKSFLRWIRGKQVKADTYFHFLCLACSFASWGPFKLQGASKNYSRRRDFTKQHKKTTSSLDIYHENHEF